MSGTVSVDLVQGSQFSSENEICEVKSQYHSAPQRLSVQRQACCSSMRDRARSASGAEPMPFNPFVLLLLRCYASRRVRAGKNRPSQKQNR